MRGDFVNGAYLPPKRRVFSRAVPTSFFLGLARFSVSASVVLLTSRVLERSPSSFTDFDDVPGGKMRGLRRISSMSSSTVAPVAVASAIKIPQLERSCNLSRSVTIRA